MACSTKQAATMYEETDVAGEVCASFCALLLVCSCVVIRYILLILPWQFPPLHRF